MERFEGRRHKGTRLELAVAAPYLKVTGLMWKPTHINLVGGNFANSKADNENSSESQADIDTVQSHQVADEDEGSSLFPEDRNEPNNDNMWERGN